ncbi:MAG: D-alanyl-D-alanine carboxypeptidase, partial [Oscillospiraceae bacterium]|nr:D-alanyl-D-alanine carboxypeptidase [Oscillospiraceae bacterium]
MKKFKFCPLLLLISPLFACASPAALALEDPQTQAQAIVLADLDTGEIVYSKNMEQQRSPASLTKIMTVLLALEALEAEQCSMEDMVTAGADCLTGMSEDSSTSGIVPGEQMSFKDLLHCALIQSANESCNILATYLSGSIGAFVEQMNQRAAQLGCVNTRFVDPNGLSSENITTAYDLFLITREAISHPDFMSICNTTYYEVPATNMSAMRPMYNSNALISAGSIYGSHYVYEGAAGVKTGYTRAAGYCLISTAEKDGLNMLAVVLGCDGQLNAGIDEFKNFESSIKLYDWVFGNFAYRTVLTRDETVSKVNVELAKDGVQAELRPQNDVELLLPTDLADEDITVSVSLQQEKLVAPIAAGVVLGEAKIM